jgi:predicted nucleic acid-binding Zn ribbon protein
MNNCPLCGNDLGQHDIVCSDCIDKITLNEPKRREDRIRNVADTLLVFLAVFLFLKGAFAMWGEGGYASFITSLGFPGNSEGLHYFSATTCIIASLGYAVTSLGNYLGKTWTLRLCLATLCFFALGQAVVQLGDIHEHFGFAKAISVIFFLIAVPVLQYVMATLGGPAGRKE